MGICNESKLLIIPDDFPRPTAKCEWKVGYIYIYLDLPDI